MWPPSTRQFRPCNAGLCRKEESATRMGMSAISSDMAKQRRALLSSFLDAEASAAMRLGEVDAVRSAVEAACNTHLPSPLQEPDAAVATVSYCFTRAVACCPLSMVDCGMVPGSLRVGALGRRRRDPWPLAAGRAPSRWRSLWTCCTPSQSWAGRSMACRGQQACRCRAKHCPRRPCRTLRCSLQIFTPVKIPWCMWGKVLQNRHEGMQ